MKIFLKRFFLFLPFVPLIYIFGLLLYVKVIPGFMQTNVRVSFYRNFNTETFKEIDTTANVDMLIAGPSSGFRSFDPRIFNAAGISTFIMGSSAQSPIQTEYLVNKYLDKINPKLFVYVIDMQSFSSDGAEGWLFLMNNLPSYDSKFMSSVIGCRNLILFNTLCYNVVTSKLKKPDPLPQNFETYVGKGFVQYLTPVRDSSVFSVKYASAKCVFDPAQQEAFLRIMDAVKKRNIPMIFVQTPITHNFFNRVTNPGDFDNYIRSFSGIHYINFNYYNFTDRDMWDVIHMNQNGVVKFDQIFLDSLASWKYLPVKRG